MIVDYTALTKEVTEQDLIVFRSDPAYKIGFLYSKTLGAIAGFLVAAILFYIPLTVIANSSNRLSNDSGLIISFVILGFSILIGIFISIPIRKRAEKKLYRLVMFAKQNGWHYITSATSPAYEGMIFNQGHSRQRRDIIQSNAESVFEVGNYFYITGSGKNQQSHDWGYMRIKLERHLPNMVLDAKKNNFGLLGLRISNLPDTLTRDQILSLEGDFNDHFTLYAPKDYERDALYIFTPDLMALLIDTTAQFDVEIVDEWLYVYSPKKFDMHSQANYERLFSILQTVGTKTLKQTKRYEDEHVGVMAENTIAPQGQRLKSRLSVWTILAIILTISYFILIFISSFS